MDQINQYAAIILAAISFFGAATVGIVNIVKSYVTMKKLKKEMAALKTDVIITREGVVEAFKKAKISPELKLSISTQVNKLLTEWMDKMTTMLKTEEELRTNLAVANTKILSYTAAFNKLNEEEKAKIEALINEVTDKDITVEV